MKRSRYYPEGRNYLTELPATLHALLHFIRRVQAETSFLSADEMELWVRLEMRPWSEPLRERFIRHRKVVKNLKPTYEEFLESRNQAQAA